MTNMNLKITKAIMISISKCVEKTTAKAYLMTFTSFCLSIVLSLFPIILD